MKYYSETLEKLFNSEDELFAAEERAEKLANEEKERKNKLSADKKMAATKVQLATEEYDKAVDRFESKKKEILKELDTAEDEAAKIIDKANNVAEAKLEEAKEELRKAKIAKINAIKEFEDSYGPYKTVLTGDAAKKEWEKIESSINEYDKWLNKLFQFRW